MRTRSFLPLIWHILVCAGLGAAFLIVSAPQVWEAFRTTSFGPVLPYHTTNSYMLALLKVQSGSERLLDAFSALPPNRPVAVILPDGKEDDIFLSYLVGYFGWPREARCIPVTRENAAAQLRSLDRASLVAIFFCGIDPPPGMHPLIRIGSGLVMVPLTETPEAGIP